MRKDVKHVIYHRGSPHGDDFGWVIGIAGGIIVIPVLFIGLFIYGIIVTFWPFLLVAAVGVVGATTLLSTQFGKLKLKGYQLRRLRRGIEKAQQDELRSEQVTVALSEDERALARKTAQNSTMSLADRFEQKRSEILLVIDAGIAELSNTRNNLIKNAKDAKSSHVFERNIKKLDKKIQLLESLRTEYRDLAHYESRVRQDEDAKASPRIS